MMYLPNYRMLCAAIVVLALAVASGVRADYNNVRASYYDISGRGEWDMNSKGPPTSCGTSSTNREYLVAVSYKSMDKNWMCYKPIWIWANNRAPVKAWIVDTMMDDSRGPRDLDMTPALFDYFAPRSKGITTVSWNWA